MGSVIALVGDSPSDRATIHYDGFGNVRRVGGSAGMVALPSATGGDFRFQGMWSDAGTGLYYVRARVYDAQTGRFLSRDPAEGEREDPIAYLAYAFANANPLMFFDPTGRVALLDQMEAVSFLGQTEAGIASSGLHFMRSLELAARGVIITAGVLGAGGAATGADDFVWDVGLQTIAGMVVQATWTDNERYA
jgi:RHS repeat-associated protein